MEDFNIDKYHHSDASDEENLSTRNSTENETENIENIDISSGNDAIESKDVFDSEAGKSPVPSEYEDLYSGIEENRSLGNNDFVIDESKENDIYVVPQISLNDFSIDGEDKKGKGKRGKRGKKAITITVVAIVAVMAVVVVGIFCAGKALINRIEIDKTPNSNVYVNDNDMVSFPDVYNVLLIGADDLEETDGEYSRSDTMILLSLDSINKKIKLTSFMRDCYVTIPGKAEKNKLNSAYQDGGQQLAMDTLEYNFGVNIDAYIMVNFTTFVETIEKLGGINVDITEKEAKYIQKIAPHLKAGSSIQLNGDEALLYSRIRHLDSDFNRTARQRKIVEAILDKAKMTNPITILNMTFQVADDIKTSISQKEISKLASSASTYSSYEVEQFRIPADETFKEASVIINKIPSSILDIDVAKNKAKLFEFIYPQEASKTTTVITTKQTTVSVKE